MKQPKLPKKFPAKNWKLVKVGNKIRKWDVWDIAPFSNPSFDTGCLGAPYNGYHPLYRYYPPTKHK